MSRSRKKHPITGTTTARSEKDDKRRMNRMLRRRTRKILSHYDQEEDAYTIPLKHEVMNQWNMAKDGRTHSDPPKHPVNCETCVYQLQCLVGGRWEECMDKSKERWYKEAIRK